MTPDPVTVATRYGLPWGIATGLAAALFFFYYKVYQRECEKNDALTDAVRSLVGDVKTLLALAQKGGTP